MCASWSSIETRLNDQFDNKPPVADACRLLYSQAIRNGLNLIDMEKCIGEIYRDEPMDDDLKKIPRLNSQRS